MREPVRLSLRVQPRSSRNEIVGFDETGTLRVRVTAPPVEGAANKAVVEILSEALGVPKSNIAIASGQSGRLKLVDVTGLRASEVRNRLDKSRR